MSSASRRRIYNSQLTGPALQIELRMVQKRSQLYREANERLQLRVDRLTDISHIPKLEETVRELKVQVTRLLQEKAQLELNQRNAERQAFKQNQEAGMLPERLNSLRAELKIEKERSRKLVNKVGELQVRDRENQEKFKYTRQLNEVFSLELTDAGVKVQDVLVKHNLKKGKERHPSPKKQPLGTLRAARKQEVEDLTKERDKLRKDTKTLSRMMTKYRDQAARQIKSLQSKVEIMKKGKNAIQALLDERDKEVRVHAQQIKELRKALQVLMKGETQLVDSQALLGPVAAQSASLDNTDRFVLPAAPSPRTPVAAADLEVIESEPGQLIHAPVLRPKPPNGPSSSTRKTRTVPANRHLKDTDSGHPALPEGMVGQDPSSSAALRSSKAPGEPNEPPSTTFLTSQQLPLDEDHDSSPRPGAAGAAATRNGPETRREDNEPTKTGGNKAEKQLEQSTSQTQQQPALKQGDQHPSLDKDGQQDVAQKNEKRQHDVQTLKSSSDSGSQAVGPAGKEEQRASSSKVQGNRPDAEAAGTSEQNIEAAKSSALPLEGGNAGSSARSGGGEKAKGNEEQGKVHAAGANADREELKDAAPEKGVAVPAAT